MKQIKPVSFFLSAFSKGSSFLSHEEYGIYLRLLEYMWQSSCKLPNDDRKIANLLHIRLKKWQSYKKNMQSFFIFRNDNFTHKELQSHYNKLLAKARQNSLNASKRWASDMNPLSKKASSGSAANENQLMPRESVCINDRNSMRARKYARASKSDLKDKRFDYDGASNSASPESQDSTKAISKIASLFEKYSMSIPEGEVYFLSRWLEQGISLERIYSAIEKVLLRITRQKLKEPKSFAYFSKEIEQLITHKMK